MADYIVRKRKSFVFSLEDEPDQSYALPALSSLSFEDVALLAKADKESDIPKRGKIIREFILRYAPALADKHLSGMEYFEIYNAYAESVGRNRLGESQASQDS